MWLIILKKEQKSRNSVEIHSLPEGRGFLSTKLDKLKLEDFSVFNLTHNGYNIPYKTTLIAIETNSRTLIFPIIFNTKFLDFFILPIDLGIHRKYDDYIYNHHYIYSPFDTNYGESIYYEIYGEFKLIDNKIINYKSDQNCFNKDILYLSVKIKNFPKKESNLKYTLIIKIKQLKNILLKQIYLMQI